MGAFAEEGFCAGRLVGMSSHLSASLASSYQHDLRRAAEHSRVGANRTRRESLFRRALSRLHADAGSSASARSKYEVAPTAR